MSRLEEDIYDRPFSLKVWKGMLPFFRPYRREMAYITALMLLCAVIDVLIPIYQKYIIDHFIVPKTTAGIGGAAAVGAAGMVVQMLATLAFTRAAMRVEMNFSRDLKKALFDHLQTLSLSYYNTTPVGYIISRVMSDTSRIGGLVAWGLVDVMWGLSYVVFVMAAMLVLDWRLGLVLVLLIPVMALITSWFQNRILKHNRKVRRTNSRITGAFNEGINGARTSKTLVIEEINSREFAGLTGEMYSSSVRAATLAGIFMPIILFIGVTAVAIILVQGSRFVVGGTMALGTLSAMISYGVNVFEPVSQIARIFSDVVATQANIERVEGLLETKPMIVDSPEVVERYGDSFEPKRENWEKLRGTSSLTT